VRFTIKTIGSVYSIAEIIVLLLSFQITDSFGSSGRTSHLP
jgi:hypothetical protein